MKRGSWLRRRTPLVARRPMRRRPRRARPGDDPAYLALVRTLPCCARHLGTPCRGIMHAHHAGEEKGVGMKPPDRTAIPMCSGHHLGEWHDDAGRGAFRGWTQAQRRAWSNEQIAATLAALVPPPFDAEQDRVDESHESWSVECCQGVE